MNVVLLRDIRGTGKRGDVVTVPDGFARNFLLPQKFAEPATPTRIEQKMAQERRAREMKALQRQTHRELTQRLNHTHIELHVAASPNGRLFGSIGTVDIATALKEKGFMVPLESLRLSRSLDTVGTHHVAFQLEGGTEGTISVTIAPAHGT